ncbi:MAG: hypothetical protein COS65_09485 [Armatimonadetes bacterium CG06_land_8_20_14_3_00_66_21]|nr:MAG: hypothetical protein COS65_09485 [Armatimonadetes bacterium CG06_land_8_20_14_3_00_66_21]PIX43103.1 MAG: hypothetical protein COZ57_20045 [Armatimonadetes bacterium CG_4_8_14_3_um_filter_66_20]
MAVSQTAMFAFAPVFLVVTPGQLLSLLAAVIVGTLVLAGLAVWRLVVICRRLRELRERLADTQFQAREGLRDLGQAAAAERQDVGSSE